MSNAIITCMKRNIDIPAKFASDHYERDLSSGTLIKRGRQIWTFECTEAELREWLEDAEHYSDCASAGWGMGREAVGLQASARATVKRVQAALAEL